MATMTISNLSNFAVATAGAVLALAATTSIGAKSAQAAQITATLTADNHYGLYYGQANGDGLTFVGRNELGSSGAPGAFNWSLPEQFNFNVDAGDYLYALAWDTALTQSWIGEFQLPNGSSLLSNTSDWEYFVSSEDNPAFSGGNLPSIGTVASDISSATWATPQASAPQGSDPWGIIPGISSSAQFVWHDTLVDNSSSDNHYVIFRTRNSVVPPEAVPEPASVFGLLAIGVLGFGSVLKKKLRPCNKV